MLDEEGCARPLAQCVGAEVIVQGNPALRRRAIDKQKLFAG